MVSMSLFQMLRWKQVSDWVSGQSAMQFSKGASNWLFFLLAPLVSFVKWIMGSNPKPNASIFIDKVSSAIAHAHARLKNLELFISCWAYQFRPLWWMKRVHLKQFILLSGISFDLLRQFIKEFFEGSGPLWFHFSRMSISSVLPLRYSAIDSETISLNSLLLKKTLLVLGTYSYSIPSFV